MEERKWERMKKKKKTKEKGERLPRNKTYIKMSHCELPTHQRLGSGVHHSL